MDLVLKAPPRSEVDVVAVLVPALLADAVAAEIVDSSFRIASRWTANKFEVHLQRQQAELVGCADAGQPWAIDLLP